MNLTGSFEGYSEDLKEFVEYLRSGMPQARGLTAELENEVEKVKRDPGWAGELMKLDNYVEMREANAMAIGEEKGIQKGIQEGISETQRAVAKEMLANGEPREKIRMYSHLSDAALDELKAELMGTAS